MTDKSSICTTCDKRHIYRQSTDWCFECEQALCAECKEFHGVSISSRNHATVPITVYQTLAPSVLSVSIYCSDHQEKYQIFCQTHDKLLCLKCMEEHSKCEDVVPLSKITKNVKTSEAFRDAEQCLVDNDQNIFNIEDKIIHKLIVLNEQKEIILSEISKVRQNINDHLDQIEAVVKKDVSYIEDKARIELETALTVLKDKKERNSSSKQQLESLKKHASDLLTFFALRQISSGINTTETFLQSIIDKGQIDKITLEFSFNENLRSITNNIKTFGSVRAAKSPCDLTLVKQKDKQARLVGVQSTSIHDIKLKLTRTITTNIDNIRGCDILPDGKLVFCERSGRRHLVVTDTDGKHLIETPIPNDCFDLTCINDKTVAITTDGGVLYGIAINDISCPKILQLLAKYYRCHGITSVNGSLVYCAQGKGIEMVDVNGENTSTIVRCDLPPWSYIESYKDKLYYTKYDINTVTCCDMKGNTIWTFKDETVLRNPCGIAVDNDGHVYVVSCKCTSVVVLSADGQQSRQILTEKDGLNYPSAIRYDRTRKQLLVVDQLSSVLLFSESS